MSTTYYNKLEGLIADNKLHLKLVVALPRTGSTLLQTSLYESSDVNHSCHEPFLETDYYYDKPEIDYCYKNIYEQIGKDSLDTSSVTTTAVVKVLSHRLREEEHERLFALTKSPILFLIRNPLLSVESRVRKVLQSISQKPRILTQE